MILPNERPSTITMALDRKTTAVLCLVLLMGMFFYLYGLDRRILWEDETVTANLAVNILKYGIPMGDDGTNSLIFSSADDINKKSVWVFSPWLSEYITAASFAVLGRNEVAARLPFAVLGFLAVIFMFYVVWDCFKDRQLALITLLLLVTNETLILHCRQSRYYAVSFFMQVLLIYAFYLLLKRRRVGIALIVAALTCQFYSSYLFVPGNIVLIVGAGFMFRRKYPGVLRDSVIAAVIASAFAAVWFIYAQLWIQTSYVGDFHYYNRFLFYIMEVNMTMFPLLALALLLWYRRGDFTVSGISMDMTFFIAAAIPSQFLFIVNYNSIYVRYLIVLIPVFIVLLSIILRKSPPILRYTVVALLCCTNLMGYAGLFLFSPLRTKPVNIWLQRPEITLKNIIMERITPYVNRSEEVLTYLQENAGPGQTLVVAGYGSDFPVIFYTKMKVLRAEFDTGGRQEMPDWILPQTVSGITEYFRRSRFSIDIAEISDFLKTNYDMIKIEVHNSSPVGSVPESDLYEYFTAAEKTTFIAFRKKTLPPPPSASPAIPSK
ncbi:MAG: glycosyltransferase family 39 protein [Candidatus Magnetominusculus sp. LBB02]|nr:glycosyltransferase family 39 protein [Candidatus Magnetominusculus sp. LBB02]